MAEQRSSLDVRVLTRVCARQPHEHELLPQGKDRIQQLFPLIDANSDGFVDETEMQGWHLRNGACRTCLRPCDAHRGAQVLYSAIMSG